MIVGLFPELLATGGVQRAGLQVAAVLRHYAELHRRPYRFLSLNDPGGEHRRTVAGQELSFRGFGRSRRGFVTAAVRELLNRPRLAVAAHPHLAPLVWAMNVMRPPLRTVVLTHGVEVWTPLSWLRQSTLRRADLVLAPSSDTVRSVVAVQRVSTTRVRCVPWGLDPQFAGAEGAMDGEASGALGFPDGKVVLTVGRQADRDKGFDMLIEALVKIVPAVPDVALVVVGDGDDRLRLERLARDSGVEARVHFLGHVPVDTLAAAYRRCDVFAMPSAREGFGLVFLEAMAFGRPVVGGAHGGTTDLVADGETGYLVRHDDVARLAQVLERLLTDDGLRKEMGQHARDRVHASYLFEHFERRLTDVLDEACAR